MTEDPKCPRCGATLEREYVDVGVGPSMPRSPWGCEECHWTEADGGQTEASSGGARGPGGAVLAGGTLSGEPTLPGPKAPSNGDRAVPTLVLLETPYAAPTVELLARNLAYARAAMRDSLLRGEAPFASHLLYAQVGVLEDSVPAERELGMCAGWAWGQQAARVVCYVDLGISPGMSAAIDAAQAAQLDIEMRNLPRSAWEP